MARFIQLLCHLKLEIVLILSQVMIKYKCLKNAQYVLSQRGDMHQRAIASTPGYADVSLDDFELCRSLPQCNHEDSRYLALELLTQGISSGSTPQSQVDLDRGCVESKKFVHLDLYSGHRTYD